MRLSMTRLGLIGVAAAAFVSAQAPMRGQRARHINQQALSSTQQPSKADGRRGSHLQRQQRRCGANGAIEDYIAQKVDGIVCRH
jgi:hypothetical protein